MRRLVLLAVLASACDQGATAAPAPVATEQHALEIVPPPPPPPPPMAQRFAIRSTDEFVREGSLFLDEFLGLFTDGSKDCELIATRVETFLGANTTRIGVLTEYGNAHPDASKALQVKMEAQMPQFMKAITPSLTECMSNQRLTSALQKLGEQQQQQQQR